MRRYLWRRAASIPVTILFLITLIWVIIEVQPGDFSQIYIGNSKISASYRETLARELGLTGPALLGYLHFVKNIFTANLGISFSLYPRPVWEIIVERLPRTAALFPASFFIQLSLGYLLGRAIGWRRQGALDYGGTILAAVFWCSFLPSLSSVLIWAFSMRLGLLPPSKFVSIELLHQNPEISINRVFDYIMLGGSLILVIIHWTRRSLAKLAWGKEVAIYLLLAAAVGSLVGFTTEGQITWDVLRRMILPILTLTVVGAGFYMLLMRDSMVETVTEDYVLLARAKGLRDRLVRNRHAARNALFPLMSSFLLAMAFTLDASIITESVFSWPGIGLTLLEAFTEKDMPLAIGIMVFLGVVASVAHLLIDLLYAYLDPRVRYGQ